MIHCNETGVEFIKVYPMENVSQLMDITEQLSIRQNQQCNISVVFSNSIGSSKPYEQQFSKCCVNSNEVFG